MSDFFPYSTIRKGQQGLLSDVKRVIDEKKHLVVHAPTGIGKSLQSRCSFPNNKVYKTGLS